MHCGKVTLSSLEQPIVNFGWELLQFQFSFSFIFPRKQLLLPLGIILHTSSRGAMEQHRFIWFSYLYTSLWPSFVSYLEYNLDNYIKCAILFFYFCQQIFKYFGLMTYPSYGTHIRPGKMWSVLLINCLNYCTSSNQYMWHSVRSTCVAQEYMWHLVRSTCDTRVRSTCDIQSGVHVTLLQAYMWHSVRSTCDTQSGVHVTLSQEYMWHSVRTLQGVSSWW